MAKKKDTQTQLLDALVDELLKEGKNADELLGQNGLLKQMTGRLLERMLEGELTHHLGYEKNDVSGHHSGNSRNGTTSKTVKTDTVEVPINVPRDRNGDFEPVIVGKHQTRLKGFVRGLATAPTAPEAVWMNKLKTEGLALQFFPNFLACCLKIRDTFRQCYFGHHGPLGVGCHFMIAKSLEGIDNFKSYFPGISVAQIRQNFLI